MRSSPVVLVQSKIHKIIFLCLVEFSTVCTCHWVILICCAGVCGKKVILCSWSSVLFSHQILIRLLSSFVIIPPPPPPHLMPGRDIWHMASFSGFGVFCYSSLYHILCLPFLVASTCVAITLLLRVWADFLPSMSRFYISKSPFHAVPLVLSDAVTNLL